MKNVAKIFFAGLISICSLTRCYDMNHIFFYNSQSPMDVSLVGGKAYNLHELQHIHGITVPRWFCVSSSVLSDFLNANNITGYLEKLDSYCKNYYANEHEICVLADDIKNSIIAGPLPVKLVNEIRKAMSLVTPENNDTFWAIRSSGCTEDSAGSSLAGLYDSYLNKKSFDEICQAIKMVWASSFNPRVIAERARLGLSNSDALLAVVVQEMVISQVAGVAASIELSTNYPGIEISANYGTGESVVGGEVFVDKWLVHERKDYVLKALMGDKKFFYQPLKDGRGTQLESTPLNKQQQFSLSLDAVLEIASQVREIKKYYQHDVDTEFAFDVTGHLYFVQARPLVKVNSHKICVIDSDQSQLFPVIARGIYSVPGVVQGTLRFISNWQELTQQNISEHDIVVTYRASNVWSHYINKVAGLITKEGSPTAHPILLARERGIPCLIGIEENFDALIALSGKMITLDGINRIVYEGLVPIKQASESDVAKAFEPVIVKPFARHDQRINTLMNANQLIFSEGNYWLKTPTYPLKRLEQEININRFKRFSALLNTSKAIHIECRILDNFVCNIFDPFEEVVKLFEGMSLDDCEQFLIAQETNMSHYLTLTENFKLNAATWQEYVDVCTDLRAYIWLSGGLRAHVERMIQTIASELELPQYYLEECYAAVQAGLSEEDTNMQKAIHDLALTMIDIPIYVHTDDLKSAFPHFYDQLMVLGQYYRFDHAMSIEKDLNLNLVYQKVLFECEQIKQGHSFISQKRENCEQFFLGNAQLERLVICSIRNRINQSNAHHYYVRGQWRVRKELLNLGKHMVERKLLNKPDDIFDCSIEEINNFIS